MNEHIIYLQHWLPVFHFNAFAMCAIYKLGIGVKTDFVPQCYYSKFANNSKL